MNNAEANRPIANRFFEAFDALVAMGKIKSVRSEEHTSELQSP